MNKPRPQHCHRPGRPDVRRLMLPGCAMLIMRRRDDDGHRARTAWAARAVLLDVLDSEGIPYTVDGETITVDAAGEPVTGTTSEIWSWYQARS